MEWGLDWCSSRCSINKIYAIDRLPLFPQSGFWQHLVRRSLSLTSRLKRRFPSQFIWPTIWNVSRVKYCLSNEAKHFATYRRTIFRPNKIPDCERNCMHARQRPLPLENNEHKTVLNVAKKSDPGTLHNLGWRLIRLAAAAVDVSFYKYRWTPEMRRWVSIKAACVGVSQTVPTYVDLLNALHLEN